MKFQYIGPDKEAPDQTKAFGYEFDLKGEAVDVKEPHVISKLLQNRSFKLVDVQDVEVVEETEKEDPTLEQLRAECEARGIKYHHKAGVEKLAALLEAAA